MDVESFTKQQGEFLKAEVVIENPKTLFEIVGEALVEHNEKYDTDRLWIPLKLGEKEYTFDCSKTNARAIAKEIGTTKTENWVGKFLLLETYKTKTSDGKLTNAINVKEVK